MAGRIFFVKKYLVMFWTFQNGKKHKIIVFKKEKN